MSILGGKGMQNNHVLLYYRVIVDVPMVSMSITSELGPADRAALRQIDRFNFWAFSENTVRTWAHLPVLPPVAPGGPRTEWAVRFLRT